MELKEVSVPLYEENDVKIKVMKIEIYGYNLHIYTQDIQLFSLTINTFLRNF